ncbi:MerR family transcriptional regulator [Bacillus sp. 3103sda1]|uniref:MerR family transcriptional regulator n=1 Tax=Bacillus sp. 3103sda1 TaxID=2953808 RepID=UPI00209DD035|nr:MerR family transcriptional regulator [Bacillus sp. 3103sda1]MCP1123148.1 MerR family transcriptional regulator [Bacillus sp. 3103sda1]
MPSSIGKYNIKVVSNMLGIHPGTLRAWERRYQIIAPKRNNAGHRLYTEEHVQILKWLINKVNQGFTIGQAVSLLENNQLQNHNLSEIEYNKVELLVDDILSSLLKFDEMQALELLDEAFSIFSIDKVIADVLIKLLVRLKDMRLNEKITSAEERYATSFLRSRIGMMHHSMPINTGLPKVLSICAPGELCELGLFIFTTYLRRKGYPVIYIGTGIEEADIDDVIKQVNPKILFISCTIKENVMTSVQLAKRLHEQYANLCVGLSGFAFEFTSDEENEETRNWFVGDTKEEWDEWLKMSE